MQERRVNESNTTRQPTPEPSSTIRAMEWAAQLWMRPENAERVMDVPLAISIAHAFDEAIDPAHPGVEALVDEFERRFLATPQKQRNKSSLREHALWLATAVRQEQDAELDAALEREQRTELEQAVERIVTRFREAGESFGRVQAEIELEAMKGELDAALEREQELLGLADELNEMEADNQRLREALEPFAQLAQTVGTAEYLVIRKGIPRDWIHNAAAARAALQPTEKP